MWNLKIIPHGGGEVSSHSDVVIEQGWYPHSHMGAGSIALVAYEAAADSEKKTQIGALSCGQALKIKFIADGIRASGHTTRVEGASWASEGRALKPFNYETTHATWEMTVTPDAE